jgi:ccpA: catabolite control protein A
LRSFSGWSKVRSMIKTAFFPKYGICLCFPMTGSAEGRIWTGWLMECMAR